MQTLETLNRKIKTSHDLLSVVKTMKGLAAVNIRQFEAAVASLEQYKAVVDMGWQVLLQTGRPRQHKKDLNKAVCMIVGSDQGMCGQFNEGLAPFVAEHVEDLKSRGLEMVFWSMGEKMRGILMDGKMAPKTHFEASGGLSAVTSKVWEVIQTIESWRTAGNLDHIYLCHNRVSGPAGYGPVFDQILPLDTAWAASYTTKPWPNKCLPMAGLEYDILFSHLFQQYLFVSFYRAFAQSLAGENAARLMAMQSAEKNILEVEEELQARFREQRQAGITSELLDIISGFEALSDEALEV